MKRKQPKSADRRHCCVYLNLLREDAALLVKLAKDANRNKSNLVSHQLRQYQEQAAA